jgi:hypothetical protein
VPLSLDPLPRVGCSVGPSHGAGAPGQTLADVSDVQQPLFGVVSGVEDSVAGPVSRLTCETASKSWIDHLYAYTGFQGFLSCKANLF